MFGAKGKEQGLDLSSTASTSARSALYRNTALHDAQNLASKALVTGSSRTRNFETKIFEGMPAPSRRVKAPDEAYGRTAMRRPSLRTPTPSVMTMTRRRRRGILISMTAQKVDHPLRRGEKKERGKLGKSYLGYGRLRQSHSTPATTTISSELNGPEAEPEFVAQQKR